MPYPVSAARGRSSTAGGTIGASLLPGLSAHWRMEEAAGATRADAHTSGLHLTDGGVVGQAAGILGNAAAFARASSQYLSHPDHALLSMGGDVSFEFGVDVYLDTLPGAGEIYTILSKYVGAQREFAFYLVNTAGTIRFIWTVTRASGWDVDLTANTFGAPSTATWYRLQAYHDAATDTIGLLINNVAETPVALVGGAPDSTAEFQVGALGGAHFWNGRIDNLSLWRGRVLAAQERSHLWNGGARRDYPW